MLLITTEKSPNLCNLLQPPSQRNKDEQHWWRVKERYGVDFGLLRHGDQQDNQRVGEGNGSGQNDQDVHVSRSVLYSFVGLNVEVATANELYRGGRKKVCLIVCM